MKKKKRKFKKDETLSVLNYFNEEDKILKEDYQEAEHFRNAKENEDVGGQTTKNSSTVSGDTVQPSVDILPTVSDGVNVPPVNSPKNQDVTVVLTVQPSVGILPTVSEDIVQPSVTGQPSVNRQSTVSKKSRKKPTVSEPSVNRQSTVSEIVDQPSVDFLPTVSENAKRFNSTLLTAFQLAIGVYIYQHCSVDLNSHVGTIETKKLIQSLRTTIGSLKDTIYRMKKNYCFTKITSKKFYRVFTFSDSFYYFLTSYLKLETNSSLANRQWTFGQPSVEEFSKTPTVSEPSVNRQSTVSEPSVSGSSSSSSSLIHRTTTTTKEKIADSTEAKKEETEIKKDELDESWNKVQIPKVLKDLQFNTSIIKQVRNRNLLPPEELQQAFDALAFDILENNILKTKKVLKPINWFMGSLERNGTYVAPSNFKSDEDNALEEMIKRKEDKVKKIKEDEERLIYAEFVIWKATLLPEEIRKISPMFNDGPTLDMMLNTHFKNNVWPLTKLQ